MIVADVTVFPVPGGPEWVNQMAPQGRGRPTLNQAEWLLKHALHSANLTAVQLWQARDAVFFGHLSLHWCCSNFVAQQAMKDVARHTHLIYSKRLHGKLHAIE